MADFTDVFEIPMNGGRREGAGRKKGYSPKGAADILAGNDDGHQSETTKTAAEFAKARARKEKALADLNELDFLVKSGQYVPLAMVEQVAATTIAGMAQTLRSIPDNLERKGVPGATCAIVEQVIDETLASVSQTMEMFSTPAQS